MTRPIPPVKYCADADHFVFVTQEDYDAQAIIAEKVIAKLKSFMGTEYKKFLNNDILPKVQEFLRQQSPERRKIAQAKAMSDA